MSTPQADGALPSPPGSMSNSVAKCAVLGMKRRRSVPSLSAEEARRAVADDDETRLDKMQKACTTLLECLGEDVRREGLVKTPKRMAEALLACTRGYSQSVTDIVNGAVFEEDHHEMILVKDIEIHSLCEHHMVPFTGKVHIAYVPRSKVGLLVVLSHHPAAVIRTTATTATAAAILLSNAAAAAALFLLSPEGSSATVALSSLLFERSEFLIDTPHKKNLRVCPRARVK